MYAAALREDFGDVVICLNAVRIPACEVGNDLRRAIRAGVVDDDDLVEERQNRVDRGGGEILLVVQTHKRGDTRPFSCRGEVAVEKEGFSTVSIIFAV